MSHEQQSLLAAYASFVRSHQLGEVADAVAHRLWRSHGGYARLFPTERDLARRQLAVIGDACLAIERGTFLQHKAAEMARWMEDTHPQVPRRIGMDTDAVVVMAAQREGLLALVPSYTQDFKTGMALACGLERLFTSAQELVMQVFYQARSEDAERIRLLAAELAEEKAFFKRLVDQAPLAITYLDRERVVRWMNPEACRWVHQEATQVVGRPFEEVLAFHPTERVQRVLDTGEDLNAVDLPCKLGPDGHELYVDTAYVPMRGPDHQVSGMLVLAVDVTARVLVQHNARARILALEELDRLKTNFINAASHELRTPLSAILGYAEFLEDELGGPLTPQQAEFVDEIQAGTRRLQRLVDDLLDFARVEAGNFHLVTRTADLVRLIRDEVSSLRPQARAKDIEMTLELPPEPLPVPMDAMRVGQVLLNLLNNALKFTPAHGRVQVALVADEREVTVSVRDNGIGIAPEHLPRLFDKFYQVDPSLTRSHGGAGLGLSISKAIVEAHGGRMGVLSEPERGSTFWFSLPMISTRCEEPASRAEPDTAIGQVSDA